MNTGNFINRTSDRNNIQAHASEAPMPLASTELHSLTEAGSETCITVQHGYRRLLVEGTTAHRVEPLPPAAELLCAIRGQHVGDHPLARWACLLASWHRVVRQTEDIGVAREQVCERGGFVHAIDVWVERHVPQHRRGGTLHTETLGLVIDRIAAAQVRAETELMTSSTAANPTVHAVWHRLAELVDGYNDLVAEVVAGVRRLPTPAGGDW